MQPDKTYFKCTRPELYAIFFNCERTDEKSNTVCGEKMKISKAKSLNGWKKIASKWKCTSMCAIYTKYIQNIQNIQGILLKKKDAENHHSSTSDGDTSHIFKRKDCPLYCFFEAQKMKFNLMTKTNVLSWPEKKQLYNLLSQTNCQQMKQGCLLQ